MKETMGMRIAAQRKAKGMTQEELASALNLSAQAVSKWENDLSCPDMGVMEVLCNTLGVTADELLFGKKDAVIMLPEDKRKSLDEQTLRIRVNSSDGTKVKCNLPMSLVKVCLEIGADVIPRVKSKEGDDILSGLDLSKIVELAERGLQGELVQFESADGDIVEVTVE